MAESSERKVNSDRKSSSSTPAVASSSSKKSQSDSKGKQAATHFKPTKPLNITAVKRLADELERNTVTTSVVLDSCSMGAKGFMFLARALEVNRTLETLQLTDSFNLEHAQESLLIMEADINKIEKDQGIVEFIVGSCSVFNCSCEGAVSIARALEFKNTTLTRLCLASNNLGPKTFEVCDFVSFLVLVVEN